MQMSIKELETMVESIRSAPLVLLCKTPDGDEKEMSIRECVETGSRFIHIVLDDELDRLDNLLDTELCDLD